jgi:ABC-type cobalamin/Fe3+-siderophores transport system ATPase subunit
MAKRIDVKDLNAYYGTFRAVEDVTMTIEPRSVTALIGPSGCGKSTLLRTLNRMHEVIPGARVEGSVRLDDADIYAANVDPVGVRRSPRTREPPRRNTMESQMSFNVSPGADTAACGGSVRSAPVQSLELFGSSPSTSIEPQSLAPGLATDALRAVVRT